MRAGPCWAALWRFECSTSGMQPSLGQVAGGLAAIAVGAATLAVVVHYRPKPPAMAASVESPSTAQRQSDRVDLTVGREGDALVVRWPGLPEADHGSLKITDGKYQSTLNLGCTELRAGQLTYWPESPLVAFRLDVSSGGRTLTGTIHAAGTAELPDEPKPSPFDSPSTLKSKVLRNAKMTYSDRPGTVSQAPQPKPLAPISFRPQVSVVAEPVLKRGVLSRIPLLRRIRKSPQAFVPPRPLHEVRPPLAGLGQSEVARSLPIDVRVLVTESGKVGSARLLSKLDPADEPLASAAVSAAEHWNFVPARMEGEKVPGEVILHFRFEPGR